MTAVLKTNDATNVVIQSINEENPQSVQELVEIVSVKLSMSRKEIFMLVLKLEEQGLIKVSQKRRQNYDFHRSIWYLLVIAACTTAAVLVFAVPLGVYPWIYARNFFGLLFTFFLPGYALARTLFPQAIVKSTFSNLQKIELVGVSVGLSIALVSLMGLILYYSPFKLDLDAIVICLFVFTFLLSTTALFREKRNMP